MADMVPFDWADPFNLDAQLTGVRLRHERGPLSELLHTHNGPTGQRGQHAVVVDGERRLLRSPVLGKRLSVLAVERQRLEIQPSLG